MSGKSISTPSFGSVHKCRVISARNNAGTKKCRELAAANSCHPETSHAEHFDVEDLCVHFRARHAGRINMRTGKVFRYRASGPWIFDQSRSESRCATPVWRSAGIPQCPSSLHGTAVLRATSNNWMKLGRTSRSAPVPGCWKLRQTVTTRAARLLRFCKTHQLETIG